MFSHHIYLFQSLPSWGKVVGCPLLLLLLLPLASCSTSGDDEWQNRAGAVNYINITLSVSAGNEQLTRANTPVGGEEGDGRENGIDTRENEVDGVTVIFYQNAAGINATAESAAATTMDFVAYYTTTRDDAYTPKTGSHYPGEIYYTTGEQVLSSTALDAEKSYHVIVVANADLTSSITTSSTLADVREQVQAAVYTGTGKATDATKFVMTSEEDNVIDFTYSTYEPALNKRTFLFDNIHVERMAARIDYWANGAEYSEAYDHSGYVYQVGSTTDHFVLTSITPFNLNTGNEYLIKRTDDATNPYLHDETTTNNVLDPYPAKTDASHPANLSSTLTSVLASMTASGHNITMEGQQAAKLTVSGRDDIIICYPKENTITATTPYYYYATGLAFEGYYYSSGTTTGGERHLYYHFMRHQGESEAAYQAWTPATLSTATTIGAGPAMNLGIVRNNIYRVSINSITPESIILSIKVKKWDEFTHSFIYM